tara:strand:+ start:660 stop:926 length:267 start_codon:yes stop_codon:yes gene_type:complete
MTQISEKIQESTSSPNSKKYKVRKLAEKNRKNGTWPDTDATIWALRAGAPENGFRDAFLKVGRTVLVDEDKFWKAVDRLQEAINVSGK